MNGQALDGVKVIEWCEFVCGPYCAKLLADLGAEVIKIENPEGGDVARRRGPFLNDIPDPERSGLFLWLNVSKKGITLDVRNPLGTGILKQLLSEADILIEDKTSDTVNALELDYDSLKELNPRLVVTSITPFGQTGPYKEYKAYPLNSFHSGGEGNVTPGQCPFPERPPLKQANYVGEYEAAISAAGATLVALYWRQITGSGQHVDISKQEAMLALNKWELNRWPLTGFMSDRATRGYRFAGVLPCKDGYVEMAFHRQDEWYNVINFMGNPEWSKDKSLEDRKVREERGEELKKLMEPWLMKHTKEYIYHQGQAKRCPFAPYYTVAEVARSKQLEARGFFVNIKHPQAGELRYPSAPYRFSKTPLKIERPATTLGQHNEEIYCGRLGYSNQEMCELRQAGII